MPVDDVQAWMENWHRDSSRTQGGLSLQSSIAEAFGDDPAVVQDMIHDAERDFEVTDLHFDPGTYAPTAPVELLAHELTHVIQQRRGS